MAKTDTKKDMVKDDSTGPKINPRLQAVQIAMQQIEKDHGKGSIMTMGDSMRNMKDSVPNSYWLSFT